MHIVYARGSDRLICRSSFFIILDIALISPLASRDPSIHVRSFGITPIISCSLPITRRQIADPQRYSLKRIAYFWYDEERKQKKEEESRACAKSSSPSAMYLIATNNRAREIVIAK